MAHSGEGSVRVIVVALFANLGIALSKFAGWFITGSASLLAEAIHSVVDCTNQVLLLVGNKTSRKPPTETHPLGYGREAFFWSFIVAILLFSLGGMFAIYEGVHKLAEADPVSSPGIALAILGVGIALETYSFLACLKEVRAQNRFGSLWTWFRRTTSAELLVIFTEDLAALLGLVIAACGVTLSWITGDALWDAAGSIAVGALLVIVAGFLAAEVKSLLIGEAPSTPELRPAIEKIVAEKIAGGQVLRFIALQIGASEVLVSYKITPGGIRETAGLLEAINAIEAEVKRRFPEIRWQFVEPDTAE